METIWKGKQTNKQTTGGSMCRGMDAGGSVELHSMWSLICNVSEYAEELQRCIGDALEKCRVRYAGSYSDTISASGVLLPFQAIFKGKTKVSLPSASSLCSDEADRLDFLFEFSGTDNYWANI